MTHANKTLGGTDSDHLSFHINRRKVTDPCTWRQPWQHREEQHCQTCDLQCSPTLSLQPRSQTCVNNTSVFPAGTTLTVHIGRDAQSQHSHHGVRTVSLGFPNNNEDSVFDQLRVGVYVSEYILQIQIPLCRFFCCNTSWHWYSFSYYMQGYVLFLVSCATYQMLSALSFFPFSLRISKAVARAYKNPKTMKTLLLWPSQ